MSNNMHLCPECQEMFSTENGLSVHYGKAHRNTERPTWRCKANAKRRGPWWQLMRTRRILLDNFECRFCNNGPEKNLQVHHVVPYDEVKSDRFAHTIENLVTTCENCHLRLEKHDIESQAKMIRKAVLYHK